MSSVRGDIPKRRGGRTEHPDMDRGGRAGFGTPARVTMPFNFETVTNPGDLAGLVQSSFDSLVVQLNTIFAEKLDKIDPRGRMLSDAYSDAQGRPTKLRKGITDVDVDVESIVGVTDTEWTDLTDGGDTVLHKHDHGGMDGLTDVADHPGYVLIDGTRAWTGTMDAGGQLIDNAPFLRGFIDGFITENDTDTAHDIKVNPGVCADSLVNNDRMIALTSAFVKRIDGIWIEGTGNSGAATLPISVDTEYNLIIIEKDSDGTIDMLFDVSATGLGVPVDWTARRRIGSVFTDGSANIHNYFQTGDWFFYRDQVRDVSDSTGTAGAFEIGTMTVPPNTVIAMHSLVRLDPGKRANLLLRSTSSPSGVAVKVTANADELVGTSRYQIGATLVFRVDGSSQLEYAFGGIGTLSLIQLDTIGWRDERGKHE